MVTKPSPAVPEPLKPTTSARKRPAAPVQRPKQAAAVAPRSTTAAAPAKPSAAKTVVQPPKKVAAPAEPAAKKVKMVRDSFTFPDSEHRRLVELKKRLIASGTDVKKGELVRAGLQLLLAMDLAAQRKAVLAVDKIKTGRPKR